jgi:phenylalanyl-tRNA synthetase alpha chain
VAPPDGSADEAAGPSALTLSGPELTLLRRLRARPEAVEESALGEELGLSADTARGSLQRLRSKHLALVDEEHLERWRLTDRGELARARGLPERRLYDRLRAGGGPVGPAEMDALGLSEEERSVAIGLLRRRKLLEEGMPLRLRAEPAARDAELPEESILAEVAAGTAKGSPALDTLRRRGLVRAERSSLRRWSVSPEGARLPLPEGDRPLLGRLTAETLRSGAWKTATFRPYDVRAEVPYRSGPEPHPYARFLEEFAELLVGLGFSESEGPLVETEFWNSDVLYMPQEHPARSVHDVFFVEGLEGRLPEGGLVDRVAAAHEGLPLPGEPTPLSRGWRVPYRREIARRAVLRSQTTAVSARLLAARPSPPFRRYCIDRNFRPDALDATHLVEFHQAEGILGEEGTTIRDLVGVFQALAEGLGIRELRVRPSYFPFTEPSIEAYVRHPRLGWIEAMPGGMFRPEVLRPLGVEVPVAAWGIGVPRLAVVALGLSDIRELYTDDLDRLTGRGD